jgi:glycosyltransferase involved in cell wall biosynthesis
LYDLLGSVVARFCRHRGLPYVLEPLGMFGPKLRSKQKKHLYSYFIGGGLFRGAEVVIATSETERQELIEGGIVEEKIVVRRDGLNLSEFQSLPAQGSFRKKLGITEQQPLVLFLGRLSFIKGLDVLVQAFSQVRSDAKLVIAGPDDRDGSIATVCRLIQDLNLSERVILSGPLYEIEKLEALVDADICVSPSRYESFGISAAESVACGTPVLVTDKCGIAPLVEGLAGIVSSRDVKGIAAGLTLMLSDKALLERLRKGCEGVARNLSWDEPAKATEHLYNSLMTYHEIHRLQEIKLTGQLLK